MAPQEERPLLGAGAGHGAWCLMSRGKVIVFQLPRKKISLLFQTGNFVGEKWTHSENSSLLYENECVKVVLHNLFLSFLLKGGKSA